MEYDQESIPSKTTSDTPEFVQECFELKSTIDSQLDDWCDLLNSRHPVIVMGGIARIIASNCTPKVYPINDTEGSPFETGYTPKEAEGIRKKRAQLSLIATIAQDTTLDITEPPLTGPSAEMLHEQFRVLRAAPLNTENLRDPHNAIHYLYRILNAEEQVALKLSLVATPNSQKHKFVLLLNRLIDDLY